MTSQTYPDERSPVIPPVPKKVPAGSAGTIFTPVRAEKNNEKR
jgi:hypothetical protein